MKPNLRRSGMFSSSRNRPFIQVHSGRSSACCNPRPMITPNGLGWSVAPVRLEETEPEKQTVSLHLRRWAGDAAYADVRSFGLPLTPLIL